MPSIKMAACTGWILADGNWRRAGSPAGFPGGYDGYAMAIAIAPDNVNRIYVGGGTIFSAGDCSGALYRCEIAVSGTSVSMVSTYIGSSVHADIHALVFAPGDPHQLWVGCDGGVFFSPDGDRQRPDLPCTQHRLADADDEPFGPASHRGCRALCRHAG